MGGPAVLANGVSRHVLVIEDDQSNLELFREVLEDEGYRVSTTSSPDLEAQAILAFAPDVILLDLRFRDGSDGMAWLRMLKAREETRHIPVLICSAAHFQLDAIHDQLATWDCGIVPKPFELDELLTAIHGFLAKTPSPLTLSEPT